MKKAAGTTKRGAVEPPVRFFATPAAWRQWLERHHATTGELWVGFHKKATGRASITWPESVDGALCFGWIDGIRKRIDDESYRIRFTPRRASSIWSAVNVRRMQALIDEGLVTPHGLRAFEARTAAKSGVYSYEQRHAAALAPADEARLRANAAAWAFFQARPPYYRRLAIFWVLDARREETRQRRLDALIAHSAAGELIPGFQRPAPKKKAT